MKSVPVAQLYESVPPGHHRGTERRINTPAGQFRFESPMLPASIEKLQTSNLKTASSVVDITLVSCAKDVAVKVRRRSGKVDVAAIH